MHFLGGDDEPWDYAHVPKPSARSLWLLWSSVHLTGGFADIKPVSSTKAWLPISGDPRLKMYRSRTLTIEGENAHPPRYSHC